ncbi:MAG: GNAT family N-acetyltransferase [Acidimicrobiales bacterium]
MQVRAVRPDEYETLGQLTVDAYRPHGVVSEEYGAELADVAGRDAVAVVLVAVDEAAPGAGGKLLGGITYVPPGSNPMSEHTEHDVASIRMLAVADHARRRGAGLALTQAVLERAPDDGAVAVVLHSVPSMTGAHRLYEGLGFVRDDGLDFWPEPEVFCLGYRLEL